MCSAAFCWGVFEVVNFLTFWIGGVAQNDAVGWVMNLFCMEATF